MNEHDKEEVMNLIKFKKIINKEKCKKCKYYYVQTGLMLFGKSYEEMCANSNAPIKLIGMCNHFEEGGKSNAR